MRLNGIIILECCISLITCYVLFYYSNYAPTLAIQSMANEHGCQQVLWLFGDDHQLTEVGAMNLFTFWVNEKGGKILTVADACSTNSTSCSQVPVY